LNPLRTVWRFWVEPVGVEPMAAFRIAIALVLLVDTGFSLLPNLALWYTPEGLFSPGSASSWAYPLGNWPPDGDSMWRWSLISPEAGLNEIRLWCIGLMACGYLLLFGAASRLSALGCLLILSSFHARNPNIINAGDILLRCALFYLMLMPAGRAFSWDARALSRLGLARKSTSPAWPLRLGQIQLVVVYLFSGLEKLVNWPYGDWIDGEAVARSLRDPTLTRVDWFVNWPWQVFAPLTWATGLWELLFPLLVLFRLTRRWALAFGVMLHLSVFVLLEVTHFSFTTLAFYLLFVPPALLADLRGRDTVTGERRVFRVFYDTMCPVCRRARNTLARLDWFKRLQFIDLHDREACEPLLKGVSYADQLRQMYVLTPGGEVHGGFDAVRALAPALPPAWLFWPLWVALYLPGVTFAGRRVYHFIARNRFKYARCDDEVCSLHLKLLAGRTMDDEVIAQVIELRRRFKRV
jgi:predicted DCC family thiol-disulfide oxidoreductase YuxK/uncharacterized membrane protein YphA (DoxX/SURF4 family)